MPSLPGRLPRLLLSIVLALALACGLAAVLAVRPVAAQTGAPGVPTMVSPTEGSYGNSLTPTMSWQQPSGAISGSTVYNLILVDAVTGQWLSMQATTNLSYTYASTEGLQYGREYYWTVNACNGTNCSAYARAWGIWTQTTPGAPAFVPSFTPTNGVTATGTTPTLSWGAPSGSTAGSTTYTVALTDAVSGQALASLQPTTNTSITVPPGENLALGHTYDWNVNACNGSLCSGYGFWAWFSTSSAPGTGLQASPANGATGQSPTLTLSWNPPAGAVQGSTTYTISIWDPYGNPNGHLLGDIAAPASACNTNPCGWPVPTSEMLNYGQTYEWNVSACNGLACSGYNSTWFSFTTQPLPPITSSGAVPGAGTVYDPDFGGTPMSNWGQTAAGWTVTAPTQQAPSTWSLTSAALALDFPSSGGTVGGVQQTQSYALFRIGYQLNHNTSSNTCWTGIPPTYYGCAYDNGSQISVSWLGPYTVTQVFADAVPGGSLNTQPNTWTEQYFAVPQSAGASGQLQITLIGNPATDNGQHTAYPSLAYVERLDTSSGRGIPHLGLSAEPRFPKAVAASVGAGVDAATGAFTMQVTDLALPSLSPQVPLTFSRGYYGAGVATPVVSGQFSTGPLGAHWTYNWQASLTVSGNGGPVVIATPGGGSYSFTQSNGYYYPPKGVDASLVLNGYGQYVLTTERFLYYTFSPVSGSNPVTYQLSSVADRNSQGVSLSYTGSQLTRINAAGGRYIALGWNGDGTLGSIGDNTGRGVSYGYSGGNLVSVTSVLHGTTSYGYTGDHLLSSIADPLGNTVLRNTFSGDIVTAQQDAAGGQVSFGFNGGVTRMADQRGKVWTIYWDGLLRTTDLLSPLGMRTSVAYDADNNVTRVENAQNVIAAYTYDAAGNRLTASDALDYTTTYIYGSYNTLLSVTDPNHGVTTNSYDAHGNLTSTKNAGGFTTSYSVNAAGQVTAVTTARGFTTSYGYNAAGDRTSLTDPWNLTTSYTYDGVGRLLTTTDPLGHTTTSTYSYPSGGGEVDTVADALGDTTTTTLDKDGRTVSVQDADGHVTSDAYDGRGLLTTVTDALGHQTVYGYDATGNRTSVQDANSYTTGYTFDDDGDVLTVTDPLGRTLLTYTYDTAGRTATRRDNRGITTSYGYDPRGLLTGVSYSSGASNVSFFYDALGNRTSMSDGTGTTSYQYDALSRLTSVTFPGSYRVVQYAYDADNNRTTIYYSGTQRPLSLGYDEFDRLHWITDWNNQQTVFYYDNGGRQTSTVLPASTGISTSYGYDNANRLWGVGHYQANVGWIAAANDTLDADGNHIYRVRGGQALAPGTLGSEGDCLDALNCQCREGIP